jgi:streptogramin lyase
MAQLPSGRAWGSLSAVDVDRDGTSIWVADRCGGNSACLESPTIDPIFHFDASGRLIKSFGAGLLVSPHGIHVDRDDNIWVTDYQDNAPRPAGAARGRGGPVGAQAGATKGHRSSSSARTAAGAGMARTRYVFSRTMPPSPGTAMSPRATVRKVEPSSRRTAA